MRLAASEMANQGVPAQIDRELVEHCSRVSRRLPTRERAPCRLQGTARFMSTSRNQLTKWCGLRRLNVAVDQVFSAGAAEPMSVLSLPQPAHTSSDWAGTLQPEGCCRQTKYLFPTHGLQPRLECVLGRVAVAPTFSSAEQLFPSAWKHW